MLGLISKRVMATEKAQTSEHEKNRDEQNSRGASNAKLKNLIKRRSKSVVGALKVMNLKTGDRSGGIHIWAEKSKELVGGKTGILGGKKKEKWAESMGSTVEIEEEYCEMDFKVLDLVPDSRYFSSCAGLQTELRQLPRKADRISLNSRKEVQKIGYFSKEGQKSGYFSKEGQKIGYRSFASSFISRKVNVLLNLSSNKSIKYSKRVPARLNSPRLFPDCDSLLTLDFISILTAEKILVSGKASLLTAVLLKNFDNALKLQLN
ncbi:hypothetical protein BB561_001581 [Smittium simulii]|uniref:Uncharacterized protein n=1 Tax=Smittium simulii TaxID=133385 RepID=A0A2T9YU65_9FUNG|nr:hypothetical protein BB561_001581 [Smittium simulii]